LDGSFSFIHAADLHLDSPFRGFEQITDLDESGRENILARLRNCTFSAFTNIVRACVQNEVDFLVLSGDIFDLAGRSLRAQLRFRDAVDELAQRNIKVFVAWGNHDSDGGAGDQLSWPENVYFFTPGEVGSYEVIRRGREIARVYGISYPRRDVAENYALRFRRDPKAPFAVGVLHCNVGGIPGHENYSPCQLNDLLQSRFDYWALGHVHTRRVLNNYGPCIVYPGNPQGRHPREGAEKGCYLVQVSGNGLIHLRFLPVDVVRWKESTVSIAGMSNEGELLNTLVEKLEEEQKGHADKAVVAKIRLVGRGRLHRQLHNENVLRDLLGELRARFAPIRENFVWPESIRCLTGIPIDKEALRCSATLLGDLLTLSEDKTRDNELYATFQQSLLPLEERIYKHLPVPGEVELAELLEAAEDLAVDLLWEEEV